MIQELRMTFICPNCNAKVSTVNKLDNRASGIQLDFRGGLRLVCPECKRECEALVSSITGGN